MREQVRVCVCAYFSFGYAAIVYNFHMTAMLLLLLLLLCRCCRYCCCCRRVFCFIFSVFSAWVSCFRCHLVYKLFMPSTAVNSYFGISLLLCHPQYVSECVRILPRVGTNKVKSQSDKHTCYIYYILNLCVCVSARTKNWAKYWQSQNN